MSFTVETDGDIAFVAINGDITSTNSNELQLAIENIKNDGFIKIIFNLQGLFYICSLGIGVLARNCGQLTKQNGKMVFYNPTEEIKKLLSLLRLDKIIPIASSRNEAIEICN